MDHLPVHAGSVALVLNPTTGHILPQFHVGFDDTFSTVLHLCNQTVPLHCVDLVRNFTELANKENFILVKTWFQTIDNPLEAAPLDVNIFTQDNEHAPADKGDVTGAC